MCADHGADTPPPPVLHGVEPVLNLALGPVDSVEVTTLMDNVTGIFMPDCSAGST